VMAKGLEDTAFYLHNPLISVNEVGGDPNGPEIYFGIEEFHRRNLARRSRRPYTMNATSTHDTKRSEDVRARINVLSEIPEEWARCLRGWKRLNPAGTGPDSHEQILIYQSMLGAWPIERDRFKQYVTKALREGKRHTSWIEIDDDYESRVASFVNLIYSSEKFLKQFHRLQKKVAYFGALSSLSQVVLKMMSPGVPDLYRGTESWNLSLADPDNRRAVDFSSLASKLNDVKGCAEIRSLLNDWSDGRLKLFVTSKLLQLRRAHADLFLQGEYIPLRVTGAKADHVIAFARKLDQEWCIVAVPRFCASLTRAGTAPVGKRVWKDTRIELPPEFPPRGTDVFTDEETPIGLVADLFRSLALAVLISPRRERSCTSRGAA